MSAFLTSRNEQQRDGEEAQPEEEEWWKLNHSHFDSYELIAPSEKVLTAQAI